MATTTRLKLSVLIISLLCLGGGTLFWATSQESLMVSEAVTPKPSVLKTATKDIKNLQLNRPTPVYWAFKVMASATDDPTLARTTSTNISYEGVVPECTVRPKTEYAVSTDKSGTAKAGVSRTQMICVPGCEGEQPVIQNFALQRTVEVTAFQSQFDRSDKSYAPEGKLSTAEWKCDGRSTRMTAAALVALACTNPECDESQVANASVSLGIEHGKSLDKSQALFTLKSVTGALLGGKAMPLESSTP